MNNIYQIQLNKFKQHLQAVEQENTCQLEKAREAIRTTKKTILQLRKLVLDHDFTTVEEEIHFFKFIKPEIYADFFYYTVLFDYEMRKQGKAAQAVEKLTAKILKDIATFLESHRNFHHYYQLNQTHFDDKYFRRLPEEVMMTDIDCFYFQEENFSTTHDILAARMIASKKLSHYLRKVLEKGSSNNPDEIVHKSHWTSRKTDLIELIYALQAAGSVEHGKLEPKHLIDAFASIFDVDLKGYRRAYVDIKTRKNPTQFLDHLKACLLKRIDEDHQ